MFSRSLAGPALRRAGTTAAVRSTVRQVSTRRLIPLRQIQPFLLSRSSRISKTPFPISRRHLSVEVRDALSTATKSAPVVLFMKGTPETPQCGFSRNSIQILGLQGVDPAKFTAFNVLEDEDLRQGIKEFSNWPTIPQLYVDGEFVGGCDILMTMHKDGSLAELLEGKGVLVEAEGGDVQEEKKP